MKTTLAVSAVALVVLAVVAAVLVVLWPKAEAGPAGTATRPTVSSAAPLTVTGQVILKPTFDSITSGEGATCAGAGEYADIVQGAQVVVLRFANRPNPSLPRMGVIPSPHVEHMRGRLGQMRSLKSRTKLAVLRLCEKVAREHRGL